MKIVSLIKEMTNILENLDEKIIKTNYFNIISNGYENSHSNLIAWLLDPKNDKNCIFLKIFLQNVLKDIPSEKYPQNFDQIKVYREYNNIDILITDYRNFVIAIENKIKTSIDINQLNKYKGFIEQNFSIEKGYFQKYIALTKKGKLSKKLPTRWVRIKYDEIRKMLDEVKLNDENKLQIINHYKDALDQMLGLDKKLHKKIPSNNFERLSFLYDVIFHINDLKNENKIKINNLLKKYDFTLNKILYHFPGILDSIIVKYLESNNFIIDTIKTKKTRFLSEALTPIFQHPIIYNSLKNWSKYKNIFLFQIFNNRNNNKTLVLSFLLGPISNDFNFVKKDILKQIKSDRVKLLHQITDGDNYVTLYRNELLKKEDYNIFGLQTLKTKLDFFLNGDYQEIKNLFTKKYIEIKYNQ